MTSRSSSASKTRSASISRDRFFVPGVHAAGERIALASDDAHKVAHVLRMRAGEGITVVDSAGAVFEAVVDADDGAFARLIKRASAPSESLIEVTLAQAIPKGQKMDFVVEKTTELGVSAILPVRSARVIGAQTSVGKVERWRRIARSAAAQSGRTRVPEVGDILAWDALLASFPAYDRVLLPWEVVEPAPLRSRLGELLAGAQRVLAIVGPEGGFSRDEAAAATAAGAHAISLGPRILRTETAGIALLAVILYEAGEL
jgi:16S rRNA (uracil1498-N3)-methyltransferase